MTYLVFGTSSIRFLSGFGASIFYGYCQYNGMVFNLLNRYSRIKSVLLIQKIGLLSIQEEDISSVKTALRVSLAEESPIVPYGTRSGVCPNRYLNLG